MSQAPHRWLIVLVALSAFSVSASTQSVERIVFASVLDRTGRPVTDVAAKDLTVRENKVDRDVLRVTRASEPFDIAVLVDTSQDAAALVSEFRRGLLDFVRAMGGRHEIALIGFGERPSIVVDYTRDIRSLEAGIARINAHTGSGACLMDSIIEASLGLRAREHSQREIVVIAGEGQELSDRNSADVLGEAQRGGIVLDAFVVVGKQTVVRPAFEADPPERDLPPALGDHSTHERAIALADVIKATGGRREDLVTAATLTTKLRELAARLDNQYRITYEGPPSLTPPASIEIVTTRPDLRARVTGMPHNQP